MLLIAGYTIDRMNRVIEEESRATLELASGKTCFIPRQDIRSDNLIAWAKEESLINATMALRIVEDVVDHAALMLYCAVRAIDPKGTYPIQVDFLGRPSTGFLTRPEYEQECYPLLAHSLTTQREVLVFLCGGEIRTVVELSPDEVNALKELQKITVNLDVFDWYEALGK